MIKNWLIQMKNMRWEAILFLDLKRASETIRKNKKLKKVNQSVQVNTDRK